MTRPELVETLVVEKSTVASGGVAVITKLVLKILSESGKALVEQ